MAQTSSGRGATSSTISAGDFLASGQSDTISFSRIYWLPRGTHTLALAFSCHKVVNFVRGWLVAQELPKQGRHGRLE
jgi:hypothetical protein